MFEQFYKKSPIFLQTIFLNAYAIFLHWERYGKKFWKVYKEFERMQWYSYNELIEYQNERLRNLIKHCYENVPYYRRIMDERKLKPNDIKTREDLIKLPLLTREDIKKNFKDLIARNVKKWLLRPGHTSGTTGSPLEFYWDIQTCVVHHVAYWRQRSWAGSEYGEPFATLQGRVIVPLKQKKPPFWRMNYIHNQLFLSAFHLKKENLKYYFDKLEKFKPKIIEGYPSTIYILAKYLKSIGEKFPVKAILTSSETLFPVQREIIEDAFDCKIFDFYGMAERVVFASECEYHTGHHLNLDYSIVEILDVQGNPVEEGKMGRIVGTGLYNYAMPLIRYVTSDITAVKKEKCPCGRGFPLIEDITTKDEDIVVTPDGRLISPSVLTHPFKPMHNIEASQIIQEEPDKLIVKIVKGPKYSDEDSKKLLNAFRERLGDKMKIELQFVDNLEREKSGKFRWIISKVPIGF